MSKLIHCCCASWHHLVSSSTSIQHFNIPQKERPDSSNASSSSETKPMKSSPMRRSRGIWQHKSRCPLQPNFNHGRSEAVNFRVGTRSGCKLENLRLLTPKIYSAFTAVRANASSPVSIVECASKCAPGRCVLAVRHGLLLWSSELALQLRVGGS